MQAIVDDYPQIALDLNRIEEERDRAIRGCAYAQRVTEISVKTFFPRLKVHDTRSVRPPPKRADAELLTPEHKAWRLTVCRRAHWRCEWIEDGRRCRRSAANGDRMLADHIIEREDGGALYDVNNGQCLCTPHNTLKGLQARAARR